MRVLQLSMYEGQPRCLSIATNFKQHSWRETYFNNFPRFRCCTDSWRCGGLVLPGFLQGQNCSTLLKGKTLLTCLSMSLGLRPRLLLSVVPPVWNCRCLVNRIPPLLSLLVIGGTALTGVLGTLWSVASKPVVVVSVLQVSGDWVNLKLCKRW
jgi:hypothetical protein